MTTQQQTLHVLERSGRRPKTVDDHRICAHDECSTVLSRYNLKDRCRRHAEVRFPSVRGRN